VKMSKMEKTFSVLHFVGRISN